MFSKKCSVLFLWCLFVGCVIPSYAFAYLDPGTGSMILQAAIAAFVTCLVFMQNIRNKIISFFKGRKSKDKQDNNASSDR